MLKKEIIYSYPLHLFSYRFHGKERQQWLIAMKNSLVLFHITSSKLSLLHALGTHIPLIIIN